MALKEYEIEINGLPHTVQLDEEGAKALGLTKTNAEKPIAEKAARTPRNKARKPAANKTADTASDPGASE